MPKERIFTEEEKAYIARRFAETRSIELVGREVGMTYFSKMKKVIQDMGFETNSNPLSEKKVEAIKQDYIHSDLDIREIGKKHGVKDETVSRKAKKHGWKRLVWKRRYFREVWHRHMPKEEATAKMEAVSANFSNTHSGSGNPMYGKPTPQGAGNGWKGWYRDHYFRSLREVTFMIQMDEKGVKWTPGEKVSIKYRIGENERTYRPDFITEGKMIEIKPLKLHESVSVQTKADAGRRYCKEHSLEYCLIDVNIDPDIILAKLNLGEVKFARDYETRFRAYVASS